MSEPFPVKLLGVFFTLWLLDYFAATYLHYPFLYCWGDILIRPVVAPWASLALMVVSFYFMWSLVTAGLLSGKSMGALGAMVLIGGAADFARTLLAFGQSCGGSQTVALVLLVHDMFGG